MMLFELILAKCQGIVQITDSIITRIQDEINNDLALIKRKDLCGTSLYDGGMPIEKYSRLGNGEFVRKEKRSIYVYDTVQTLPMMAEEVQNTKTEKDCGRRTCV